MVNKKCLKFSLNDYFDYCHNKRIRGLALITDKQYLFYSQINNDYKIHNDIAIDLENLIHPNHKIFGIDAIRDNHIFISSLGNELFVELPSNGYFSYSEYMFLAKLLKDLELINRRRNKKIGIAIINKEKVYQEDNNPKIEKVISILKKLIIKDIKLEEEKIIGQTLNNAIILKTIKYHLDLEKCLCINDLLNIFKKCDNYYLDSFYNKYFKILLPNYLKIRELIISLNKNIPLENITYHNIELKLKQLKKR